MTQVVESARRALMADVERTHDVNSGDCWCQPELLCSKCRTVEPCFHGAGRAEVVVHRRAS
jgi:hypothetical protein